MILSDVVESSP